MRLHPNAKLTPAARLLLVQRVQKQSFPIARTAREVGVSRQTVYKWLRRYRAGGAKAMADRSSRPRRIPVRTPRLSRNFGAAWVPDAVYGAAGCRSLPVARAQPSCGSQRRC